MMGLELPKFIVNVQIGFKNFKRDQSISQYDGHMMIVYGHHFSHLHFAWMWLLACSRRSRAVGGL